MSLDEEIKEEFLGKLKLIDGGKKGAQPLLDETGACLFLNETGLCSIQLKLGLEYLSEVCWYYPRIFCQVGGSFERFLELSCEEAAKLILLDNNYMNFEEKELEPDPYNPGEPRFTFHMDTAKYTQNANAIDIFWKLRVATVAILQTRKYKVRFRMLLLCLFIQEINELFTLGRENEAVMRADSYMAGLENNSYDDLAATMPDGADRELDIVVDILKEMHKIKLQFKESIEQVLKGFDMELHNWAAPANFNENYIKYYEMYFADKEYIFENYLVHRVLSEGFPFNYRGESDLMSNYVDLLAKYNIVEFLFTGVCRSSMKFDKRKIIDCISLFTRGYEHSKRRYLM